MKKTIIMLGILASGLTAGCGEKTPPTPKKIALKCGNYDVAIEMVDKDTLKTAINGEKIEMFRAISASGAKYDGRGAATSVSLWNKGEKWSLLLNNGRPIECKPAPSRK